MTERTKMIKPKYYFKNLELDNFLKGTPIDKPFYKDVINGFYTYLDHLMGLEEKDLYNMNKVMAKSRELAKHPVTMRFDNLCLFVYRVPNFNRLTESDIQRVRDAYADIEEYDSKHGYLILGRQKPLETEGTY